MCWSRCAVAAGLADAAEMFVESYGELVKPKHEHVHDRKSSKILIRAMCTIDDEMLPNICHDIVNWRRDGRVSEFRCRRNLSGH